MHLAGPLNGIRRLLRIRIVPATSLALCPSTRVGPQVLAAIAWSSPVLFECPLAPMNNGSDSSVTVTTGPSSSMIGFSLPTSSSPADESPGAISKTQNPQPAGFWSYYIRPSPGAPRLGVRPRLRDSETASERLGCALAQRPGEPAPA
jgi:hypothetical protein